METRHTNPDMNKDDLTRPDRAKYDEMGRTTQGGRSEKQSPREQPAKAVHPDSGTTGFGKSATSKSEGSISNRGDQYKKKGKTTTEDEE